MGKFKSRTRNVKSFLISRFIFLNGIISIVILGLILAFLIANSIRFFSTYPFFEFLTGQKWSPTVLKDFGFLPLLTGSALVTFGAIIIAIPLGIGSAVYIGDGYGNLKFGDDAKSGGIFFANNVPELVFDHNKIFRDYKKLHLK